MKKGNIPQHPQKDGQVANVVALFSLSVGKSCEFSTRQNLKISSIVAVPLGE